MILRKAVWGVACLLLLTGVAYRRGQAADRLEGAAWSVTAAGFEDKGIRALSGADGVVASATRGGARCLTTQAGTTPPSAYLYFQVDAGRAQGASGPIYAVVSYFDDGIGAGLRLEYDSAIGDDLGAKYRAAEEQAGGWSLGARQWKTAIFRLQRPLFAHRENLGADFRLSGPRLFVRSVRLTHARPANWEEADRIGVVDVKPLVHIGPGKQLIIGGFDPAHVSDAVPQSRALEAAMPALKSLGVTSHEGYVRWNLCEPAPGRYDWSVYDRFVQVYKRHGLKWVPFLIIGSAYSLPDWYYKKPGSQGYVCLEHGQESDVQSLWNPTLRQHVARFIKAFCDHYRPTGVIESILLGITGNYGEAIYPVTGNDWTADIHGPYHTHPGYWAGDKYAVESFRLWLIQKYGGTSRLRDAWGTQFGNINQVRPFLRKDAPNDRAWLDFVDWYIGSITDYARFWLRETRKNFPQGGIYLCTGGHAPPEHGSDFGAQCKAAAEIGGGVRITNEGSDYRANFSLTRWVASAGRQYRAYFSFEPAGGVDANGVIARIYNAATSGALGLHYYFPNLFDSEQARQNFIRWGGQFRDYRPYAEIAVYYPETYIKLHGNDFLGRVQPLRDRFDFDYMSDGQIADGGLERVKALILLEGSVSEAKTWQAITEWVRQGGVLFYADGMGRLRTVEGDDSPYRNLLGVDANQGKGRVLVFHGNPDSAEYRAFVTGELAKLDRLSPAVRAMVQGDGQEDGVFVAACKPNLLVWLNYTPNPARKEGSLTLPPFSIVTSEVGPR